MAATKATESQDDNTERRLAAIMFTDIVGYTALTQANEKRAIEILDKHNKILRPFFSKYRGKEIKTIGDSFLVEFASALEATLCATAIQQSLHDHNAISAQDKKIEVRIGIHLGDVIKKENDVFGDAVNIASRIQPLADPEGVCLSEQVYSQIHNKIDYPLEEMGRPKLKNVDFPILVYKVVMPWQKTEEGYEKEEEIEPTLGEASTSIPNNLPRQPPLIGRENVIEVVWPIVLRNNVKVVTLTGPGGIGKTSVAIEVARSLLSSFPNGVYFVPFASISDSNLVLPTIAKTVGIKEQPKRPLIETLKEILGQRQMLLLLDNFEQLVSSSSTQLLSELSDSCPRVKFIVTSRKPLHIRGEQEFSVPSLSVPSLKTLPSIGELSENASVALFLERVYSIKPDFEISNDNARDIAEICVRLDGLPLAIELAAARIKILPPRMILSRLGNKLGLLTGGARDVPSRQQTLRNTIAWSHDLLSESEKKMFRRLAVFVGGFTLEAAESICIINNDLNALDDITGLLDNSLLKRLDATEQDEEGRSAYSESEYRFGYLETIRDFAVECLKKTSETEAIERTRTDFFIDLARKAELELNGPSGLEWLERLEFENDNFRASLRWCIDRKESAKSLCLAGSMGLFWEYHAYLREGCEWLDSALKSAPLESSIDVAKAITKRGILAVHLGDYQQANNLFHQAYSMSLGIEDKNGVAQALRALGFCANRQGEFSKASVLYEESTDFFRELQNNLGIAFSLMGLSWSLRNLGNETRAKSILKESVEIFRKLGDKYNLAMSLDLLGNMGIKTEDYNASRSLLTESLAIAEEIHDNRTTGASLESLGELNRAHGKDVEAISYYKQSVAIFENTGQHNPLAWSCHNMGHSLVHEKKYSEARKYFIKSLSLFRDLKEKVGVAHCLAGLGAVAVAQELPVRAARLLGATEAILESTGASLDPVDLIEFERNISLIKNKLGNEKFLNEKAIGEALTLEQAIAYGLEP